MTLQQLRELENYDTPSITNAVATYPNDPSCLALYSPWEDNWYTDESIRCMYPDLAPKVGYAVTAVYGLPGEGGADLPFADLLRTVAAVNGPVIVAIEQRTPPSIKHKFGLLGGNMVTAMRACGAVGVVSNGPSRDWDEIKPLNFQMLLTGLTPGHGDFALKAINVDVSIGGMDVSPGEILHMDCNGAVKFPANYIEEVNKRVKTIVAVEARRQAMMRAAKDPETVIAALAGLYD